MVANVSPADAQAPLFTIRADSIGPLDRNTPVTRAALSALFAKHGLTVRDPGGDAYPLDVLLGDELLFQVWRHDDGSVATVQVTSRKIAIGERPAWKIGAPFQHAELLTYCECYAGDNLHCAREGEHVEVTFRRTCNGPADARERRTLEGAIVESVIWSPVPFAPTGAL